MSSKELKLALASLNGRYALRDRALIILGVRSGLRISELLALKVGQVWNGQRPHTQRIWQRFTLEERLEFIRLHAARWNILRHRIGPEIHAQLTTAQLIGQLQVHAAKIERVTAEDAKVCVHLSGGKTLKGDLVINATGPNTKFTATSSTLLQNLLRRGLVTPDETEMGARVDTDHTIIGRNGQRSELLLALGPLLRGTLWETIAVPELRGQARRTAETLLNQTITPAETQPVMMEYMI